MANPGHVEGEGSAGDKFRVSGTQETVEGAGANEVSGVLSEASCCRCGAPLIKNHRASRYGLEAPRMAIAVPDEWQESEEPGTGGCVWQVGVLPANHRASEYALECCLEGFAALDGHKSVPSREPICPGGP